MMATPYARQPYLPPHGLMPRRGKDSRVATCCYHKYIAMPFACLRTLAYIPSFLRGCRPQDTAMATSGAPVSGPLDDPKALEAALLLQRQAEAG